MIQFHRRKSPRSRARQKGQVSIMVAMMLMTFILLFTFVVNVGVLVNAKINLQNAADLAAYSGASVQARLLNQVSYLNYEMRRQYKKFLFRYYVIGGMAQGTRPATNAPDRPRDWRPRSSAPSYTVPSVCAIFNKSDNYCQLEELKQIEIPKANPLDQISVALVSQLTQLEKIRKDNCASIADTNLEILLLWLFNTDWRLTELGQQPDLTEVGKILKIVRGMANGLGLVPKEILLSQRIQTLADYVNSVPMSEVNIPAINKLQAAAVDTAAKERTIQAFLSAYNSLGNHTFVDDSISMDELLPKSGDQANLLKLDPFKVDFDAYAIQLRSGSTGNCEPKLIPVTLSQLPVAVVKDPTVLTYYAVRLKAKARLLFSPFGEVTLKAYSSAQPFGSRIGPAKAALETGFFHPGAPPQQFLTPDQQAIGFRGQIPNLPVTEDSLTVSQGHGWDNDFVIGRMFAQFWPRDKLPEIDELQTLSPDLVEKAYHAAMVPNPGERRFYNIINDLNNDPFVLNFDSTRRAAFWAPVISPEKSASAKEVLRQRMDALFQPPQNSSPTGKGLTAAALDKQKAFLTSKLLDYINTDLAQGGGENLETMNIAIIDDPFNDPPPKAQLGATSPGPTTLDPKIMLREPAAIKSSWDNPRFSKGSGRTGYSVKFVPFKTLLSKSLSPNGGQDSWKNGPESSFDTEAEADVKEIQH